MPRIRARAVLLLAALGLALFVLYGPLPSPSLPFPHPTGTAVLLTAHPDDESMFFAPTLLSLVSAGWEVWVLCLSVGDAEGLGGVRRGELADAAEVMGLGRERVQVVDDPRLPDSMTTSWEPEPILEHLHSFLKTHENITLLLTFDERGVSGHVNHASLPLALLSSQSPSHSTAESQQQLPPSYMLLSSPLTPKFIALFAWFVPLHSSPTARLSLSIEQYAQAVRAMLAHRSQMLWFRWLYVAFSRYMWVNEWVPLSALSAAATSTTPRPSEQPKPPQEPIREL
ncbi:LmbE-like protein [Calocera cornea HHB12733]|uniref:N-acetylglucosaminylphosphatidylinositol deacetylase n=1 Tax=Calocera cornea HHB12733 TaxID=1353952 RepID=A0A165F669_9BASI|nr:LmbE-like protein [Calocera cornea HHB12733]